RLPHVVVMLAVALGCSACVGSAHPAPKPRPTRFEATYIAPLGTLMGARSLPRPRHHLVRCGSRNRALCAALIYYTTRRPRTCRPRTWSTPAPFGVTGHLR